MNRTLQAITTLRSRTWIHGVVWLTLTGLFIVCHGCHGDEDTELSLIPGQARSAKKERAMERSPLLGASGSQIAPITPVAGSPSAPQ